MGIQEDIHKKMTSKEKETVERVFKRVMKQYKEVFEKLGSS